MKDTQTKERFIELRASGLSYDKIAKELQVSKVTLIAWAREFELELSNLRAIELESLLESYYLTRVKRIELLGERLKALKAELESRDLRDVPTAKLFILFTKCYELLKAEVLESEPTFAKREAFDMNSLTCNQLNTWTG